MIVVRNYWADGERGNAPDTWLKTAREMPGSWWTDWSARLRRQVGDEVPARTTLGNPQFKEVEPAPGRYVKARAP